MIEQANGAAIREIRQLKGISLRKLAALADMTPSALSYIETGRSAGSRLSISRIAAQLNIPREAIVTYAPEPAKVASA